MRIGILACLALTAGCGLYFEDEGDADPDGFTGELELASARNMELPDRWSDRVGMSFEAEPLTRTWVEFGTERTLPLPAPTALRFDGQLRGAPLELSGIFMSIFEGACTVSTGAACSGSTCFGEVMQSAEGICTFVFSGATLAGGETTPRCFLVARFHGGVDGSDVDQVFIQARSDEAQLAKARCDDAIRL